MLIDYGMEDRIPEAKEWYDGYLFGDTEIYNPWSIIKYVSSIAVNHMKFPEAYWANTSSNQIIKDMVWHADEEMKEELDILINGETIEKQIHEDITYDDIHESEDNLWNFLFFTGYMKKVSERREDKYIYLTMKIPNAEIASIDESQIRGWFDKQVKSEDRGVLNKAVLEGNTEGIENYVSELLAKTISVFDSSESFYHGFFLSLLYGVPNYAPRSNREEDKGMPDVNNLKVMAQLLDVSVDYLLDEDEKLSFNETKEPINIDDYEKTGKCRDKRDAACYAKYKDTDAIYPLLRSKKMNKAEWITDFLVQPGIIQGADYLNDMSAYYLLETGGKQLIVKVSDDFIITSEIANKVNPKKFELGKYIFKKAAYELI